MKNRNILLYSVLTFLVCPALRAQNGPVATSVSGAWAQGPYAFGAGMNTNAFGPHSMALGFAAFADGTVGVSLGHYTRAFGSFSTALGDNSSAWGSGSLAQGHFSQAYGSWSRAMGTHSKSYGSGSAASGYYSDSHGDWSYAQGFQVKSYGFGSYAMGYLSESRGNWSFALGLHNTAQSLYETVIGGYGRVRTNSNAAVPVPTDPVFTVANGTSNTARSNAMVVLKNGAVLIKPAGDLSMGAFTAGIKPDDTSAP
jgi:hypothetical protein